MSKKPHIGPFWLTPLGLRCGFGRSAALPFFFAPSESVVPSDDCVSWLCDDVGRGDSGGGAGAAGAGVAPHLPKTHPPTFLPIPPVLAAGCGPSLFRGPRFWFAMVE
jgi:hypothetical protein